MQQRQQKLILALSASLPSAAIGTFLALDPPDASAFDCGGLPEGYCIYAPAAPACTNGEGTDTHWHECVGGEIICDCC